MQNDFPKQARPTNPIFLVLILLLSAVGGYVAYSQIGVDVSTTWPLPVGAQDETYVPLKDARLDLARFQNDRFGSLRTYGAFPIDDTTTGKQNLFQKF